MGFYLVGIIYATPASFSSQNSYSKKRRSQDFDANKTTEGTARGGNDNNDDKEGHLNNVQMETKRVYLPKPMVLNLTLVGMIVLPLVTNQILASFAGSAYDRGDMEVYNKLISAMYGVWTAVVIVIFALYIFFGKYVTVRELDPISFRNDKRWLLKSFTSSSSLSISFNYLLDNS